MKKIFLFYSISIIGTASLFLNGCKNDEIVPMEQLPVLTTGLVTDITKTSATVSGKIYETGNTDLLAKGFVWDTSEHPTLEDNLGTITVTGTEMIFTANITGLTPGTVYYVRAYATNKIGTAYGFPKGFRTIAEPITVTDIDGNLYHTVTIGAQVWMVENLKTTKYNDGTPIPNVTDNAEWSALTTGAYRLYNDDVANKADYGMLYNWYAVGTGKLAPEGWHVPSKAEWETLINFLGGTGVAGGKLKEEGTTHWNAPNTDATNSSGFTALPSGFNYNGDFIGLGGFALYQSSTEEESNPDAWSYYTILQNDNAALDVRYWIKQAGCAVRCIKD